MRGWRPSRETAVAAVAGAVLGALGVLLSVWGNPANSGLCVSCFLENAAGALGLHSNPRLQYLRPELPGFILGAFAAALPAGEFRPRGGSAPLLRFVSGVFLIVGCGVFIGCPIKLGLRLAAGDFSAVAGAAGLAVGVLVGLAGLRAGVGLPDTGREEPAAATLAPLVAVLAAVVVFLRPAFLSFSVSGSGAEHAPAVVALAAGGTIGLLAQRSRLCVTGYLRDFYLLRLRAPFVPASAGFFSAAIAVAVATGRYSPGFYGQPGAHADYLWSFLAMLLVGWVAVLIGGCPFRQLVKAGEGDADAAIVTAGMLVGAAIVQSWGLAATAAGVPSAGRVAVLAGLLYVASLSLLVRRAG